jgi:bifunctional non-homologous end joining protein LigD
MSAVSGPVSPEAVARQLFERLHRLEIATSPFAGRLSADERRQARFVRPELVAEVEFRAWTADGHLRHASFRGLREDKPATEIVREIRKSGAKPPRRNAAPSNSPIPTASTGPMRA